MMMDLSPIFVEDDEDDLEEQNEILVEEMMLELMDEVSLGVCFEVHRACKLGTFMLDETDNDSQKHYEIVDEKGLDVFGQIPMKKQLECVCPNCSRNLAASRFAPHLEKCMGMGRTSSRVASRRIANSGKKESDNDSGGDENDNNDQDWSEKTDRKASKKFKKDKSNNSPRRTKLSKLKNGDIPSVGSTASDGSGSFLPAYETMPMDDRKAYLLQNCGVISEHTKKMCTRSHRCPQHSEEQRRGVRLFLLGQPGGLLDSDDVHVDIDSYEDGDVQALRDTLQWEAASNPSPADSTSTTNSTGGSKKRKKSKALTSKKKGQSKSSGGGGSAGTPSSMYDFM